jgi:hypothetical protein
MTNYVRIRVACAVAISADAANRRSVKLIPIFIFFFHSAKGINIELLNADSVKGETFEIVVLFSIQFRNTKS